MGKHTRKSLDKKKSNKKRSVKNNTTKKRVSKTSKGGYKKVTAKNKQRKHGGLFEGKRPVCRSSGQANHKADRKCAERQIEWDRKYEERLQAQAEKERRKGREPSVHMSDRFRSAFGLKTSAEKETDKRAKEEEDKREKQRQTEIEDRKRRIAQEKDEEKSIQKLEDDERARREFDKKRALQEEKKKKEEMNQRKLQYKKDELIKEAIKNGEDSYEIPHHEIKFGYLEFIENDDDPKLVFFDMDAEKERLKLG